MKLSIVSTLYKSESTIVEFVERARSVAQSFGGAYEIILVNDGSPDNSLHLARELVDVSNDIVVIDLSRNFGHHRALLTGLRHAKGDYVFLLDSDLEEDPAWLIPLYSSLIETEADMASGVQDVRRGNFFDRMKGAGFYRLFEQFIAIETPHNPVTARIMTRRFVDVLDQYDERAVFILGLCSYTGYKQVTVPITKTFKGSTSYSARRRGSLAIDAITSFTSAPLRYTFYLGLTIFSLAIVASLSVTITWVTFKEVPSGWTSLIISIWILGGLMLSAIGLVGLYIGRIFDEVKQRPRVIIRSIFRSQDS